MTFFPAALLVALAALVGAQSAPDHCTTNGRKLLRCFPSDPDAYCDDGFSKAPLIDDELDGSDFTSELVPTTGYNANDPKRIGDALRVVERATNKSVWIGSAEPWSGIWFTSRNDSLKPTVRLLPRKDGADLTFTYDNSVGTTPKTLGQWNFDGLVTTRNVTLRNFKFAAEPYAFDGNKSVSLSAFYPDWAVPWQFWQFGDYAVGISVKFPILVAQHRLLYTQRSYGNCVGECGWQPQWQPYPIDSGAVPPGQSRNITFVFRIMRLSAHAAAKGYSLSEVNEQKPLGTQWWLSLFAPYQNYFGCLYGGFKTSESYLRSPGRQLISAFSEYQDVPGQLCRRQNLSYCNQRGWTYGSNLETDGWQGQSQAIIDTFYKENYRRSITWASAGLYTVPKGITFANHSTCTPAGSVCYNGTGPFAYNYPALFASPWLQIPNSNATIGLLTSRTDNITQLGAKVGYWWGYATTIHGPPGSWDPTPDRVRTINWTDANDRANRWAEIDIAVRYGSARILGLDTFSGEAIWTSYAFGQSMTKKYPQIEFFSENWAHDIILTMMNMWSENSGRYNNPLYHSDFLTPGHAPFLSVGLVNDTTALAQAAIGGCAFGYGYLNKTLYDSGYYDAKRTYCETIPFDLRSCDASKEVYAKCRVPGLPSRCPMPPQTATTTTTAATATTDTRTADISISSTSVIAGDSTTTIATSAPSSTTSAVSATALASSHALSIVVVMCCIVWIMKNN